MTMSICEMSEAVPTSQFQLDPAHRYHFVGIGGIGMSAIAQILLARGFRVSGSDAKDSPMLERLHQLGAQVSVGHAAVHLQPGDVVVLSDAIKPDNPEWLRARELALPIVKRADLLAYLTNSGAGYRGVRHARQNHHQRHAGDDFPGSRA